MRAVVARFASVVCPPQVHDAGRLDATLAEFDLMLAALSPAARRLLPVLFRLIDHGARLHPAARGRRLTRLGDRAAQAYIGTLLSWPGAAGGLVRRVKSLIVMCYYELPEVKEEIGYLPGPYIAEVTRRRLERYGDQIRARETP